MPTLLTVPMGKQSPTHDRVVLYKQFVGVIKSVTSTTVIKVYGDASAFFADGDTILIPLKDFEIERMISGAPSYSAMDDDTTITFVAGDYTSSDIGLTVTKKIDITQYKLLDGIRDIETRIEGTLLNDFDNGVAVVNVDNSSGFFWNSSGTGLLQDGLVLWGKIIFNYHGDAEEHLVFGGLVDLADVGVDLFTRQLTIKIPGHASELLRYPAWLVNDADNTRCVNVTGVDVVGFTQNQNSEEGIKRLIFEPFGSSDLQEVEVQAVSTDTKPGLKMLEFRYPNFFKWDNGEWTKVASIADYTDANNATVKMYGNGGSGDSKYAIVKFGSTDTLAEYPDRDSIVLVNVKLKDESPIRRTIENQGRPLLTFDNGIPQVAHIHFARVIVFDDSGSSYTEITDVANTFSENDILDVLTGNDDYLLFVAPEQFFGIDFILQDNLGFDTSTIEVSYSIGGIGFSAAMDGGTNGLTDTTSDLQASGKIRWTTASGWTINAIRPSDTEAYIGYMIKVKRVSATGNCPLQEVRRILRLQGVNGDHLELLLQQDGLRPADSEEEILIESDSAGTMVARLWNNNVTLHQLAIRALDRANYPSSKRTITNLQITRPEKYFNVWGAIPTRNYPAKPTAFAKIGGIYYVALENEIWAASETGQWRFITKFTPNIEFNEKFYGIFQTQGGDIWVYAAQRLDKYDNPNAATNYDLFIVRVSTDNGITPVSSINDVDVREGLWLRRGGKSHLDGVSSNYYRAIGQDLPSDNGTNAGENLCVAYTQYLVVAIPENNNVLRPAETIDTKTGGDFPFWYFDSAVGEDTGLIISASAGYWQVSDQSGSLSEVEEIDIMHSFGSQGNLFFDADKENVYTFAVVPDGNSDDVVALRGAGTNDINKYTKIRYYDYDHRCDRSCGYLRASNNIFYFGWTEWHDDGDDTKSFSYISRASIEQAAFWDKVFTFDGVTLTEITDDVNDGVTISNAILASGDLVYFGFSSKFRNLDCEFSNHDNEYAFEYWDGSAWSALPNCIQHTTIEDDTLPFSIPRDWQAVSFGGFSKYWIRVRCTAFTTAADLVLGKMLEFIYFDSQEYDGGGFERYMPVSLIFNPEDGLAGALHGCLFNREGDDAFPFQWSYFVFDPGTSEFTITRTGDNFTFDSSYIFKDFCVNTVDDKVYGMAVNRRYPEKTAFLFKAEYTNDMAPEITLTFIGEPVPGENDNTAPLIFDTTSGNIYGITKGSQNLMWEYGFTFYPRVEIGRFNENDTIKSVLQAISEIGNYYYDITPGREISFIPRSSYRNDYTLSHAANLLESKPKSSFWKHRYDALQVSFENHFDERQGQYKRGFGGWTKKVLRINNPLVSNVHLAKLVGDHLYDFFTNDRIVISGLSLVFIPEVKPLDRVTLIIPDFIANVDKSSTFIVTRQRTSFKNHIVEIEVLEVV